MGDKDKNPLSFAGRNSRGKLETAKPLTDDDNDIFKYKGDPPSASVSNPARTKGSFSIHACLVDFFENGTNNKVSKGSLGAAIMKYPVDNSFVLVMYAPITLKQEVEIEINPSFSFQLLPEPFTVCFNDTLVGSKRNWSMKFATKDAMENFCRHIALVKDYLLAVAYNKGAIRRLIQQDLSLGEEGYQIGLGDQVKAKVSVNVTSTTHPQGLGERVRTADSRRFVIGREGNVVPQGIEDGVLGMRKKAIRFFVVPPLNAEEAAAWEVPANVTLLMELTVASIKPRSEVKERKHKTPKASSSSSSSSSGISSSSSSSGMSTGGVGGGGGASEKSVKFAPTTKLDAEDEEEEEEEDVFGSSASSAAATVIHTGEGDKSSIKARMAKISSAGRPQTPAASSAYTPDMSTALVVVAGEEATDVSELSSLLKALGLEEYEENFRDEGIGIPELAHLDAQELSSLIPKIGHRKKLLVHIKEMQQRQHQQHLQQQQQQQQAFAAGGGGERKANDLPWSKPMSSSNGISVPSSAYADLFTASFGEGPKEAPATERDIEAAYERGKNTATIAAREQLAQVKAAANERIAALQAELDRAQQTKADEVAQFKAIANEKFAALQDELDAEKTKNDNAKTLVTQLKTQMREVQVQQQETAEQLAANTERSRQFVAQTRAKEDELQQTLVRARAQHEKDQKDAVKRALEKMYEKVTTQLQANDVYDGAQMITLLKKSVKECYQSM